jgi:hypothetical protein
MVAGWRLEFALRQEMLLHCEDGVTGCIGIVQESTDFPWPNAPHYRVPSCCNLLNVQHTDNFCGLHPSLTSTRSGYLNKTKFREFFNLLKENCSWISAEWYLRRDYSSNNIFISVFTEWSSRTMMYVKMQRTH